MAGKPPESIYILGNWDGTQYPRSYYTPEDVSFYKGLQDVVKIEYIRKDILDEFKEKSAELLIKSVNDATKHIGKVWEKRKKEDYPYDVWEAIDNLAKKMGWDKE